MVCMAADGVVTASPEAMASAADWRAIFSVWLALSADCLMVAAISSIEAEASSVEEACSVAPWLSCSAVADISWLPEAYVTGGGGHFGRPLRAVLPSSS